VSLQDLEKDRFAAADLFGKRANIHADIDREGLKRSTYFKTATGKRDKIRAQRKYGQPFSFVPYAKHFYSANRIPVTEDESDAFFNRWMIVFFGQLFIERDAKDGYMVDGRLPENIHVKDERIVEKLTTPEMLSGILNILLDRARLVAAVGNIPNAPSIEQTRNAWLSNSDFTKRFLDQTVTFDGENRVPREELYQRYARWSLHIKITPDSQTEFNKKVRRIGAIDLDAKPSGRRGMTIKSWKGIRYKGESSEKPVETVEHRQPVRSTSSTALDRNPSMQLSDEALSACRDMMASINGELVTCELCEKMYLPEVLLHHQELVHGR
jgi:phage/plasmid-associated DNA primase